MPRSVAKQRTDEELFEQFLAGDDRAFLELFDRHAPRLGRYCRRMTGSDRAAEDVMQDVWERVLRQRAGDRQSPRKVVALLYWMARNLCINVRRDARPHLPIDAAEAMLTERVGVPSELEELVVLALEQLPLEQREVLILNAYSGYSFDEIAAMTGQSAGAIRMRAMRARRQLKRAVSGLTELDDDRREE